MIDRVEDSFRGNRIAKAFLLVLLVGAAVRAILLNYPPWFFQDTPTYVDLARRIRTWRMTGYQGHVTPLYPLFLLLGGMNPYVVHFSQNLLGIAIASILFAMVYRRTRSVAFAVIAGVIYNVDLSQLGFEQCFLTETLCTFLLILSVFVFQWMVLERKFGWRAHVILGTLAAMTCLTRPLYACLAPLYFIFLALIRRRAPLRLGDLIRGLSSFAAPAGVLLLGWCLLNWWTVGSFGLTTRNGANMTSISGGFIELGPPKYANIRDPYLRARAKEIAERGYYCNTIFRAYPEILAETGYTVLQLDRELTRMSLELFAAHPVLYAEAVGRAWMGFWEPWLYWHPLRFRVATKGTRSKVWLNWFHQHSLG